MPNSPSIERDSEIVPVNGEGINQHVGTGHQARTQDRVGGKRDSAGGARSWELRSVSSAGDQPLDRIMLVDNRRVLHGRTAFGDDAGDRDRLMLRTWIQPLDTPAAGCAVTTTLSA
jgi:hypothetical protein